MKARYISSGITSKEKKKAIREMVKKELDKGSKDAFRRVFKLFCFKLNSKYGFGKQRLTKLVCEVGNLASEKDQDEVFWSHIDNYLNKIGMEFKSENYEEVDE